MVRSQVLLLKGFALHIRNGSWGEAVSLFENQGGAYVEHKPEDRGNVRVFRENGFSSAPGLTSLCGRGWDIPVQSFLLRALSGLQD